MNYTDFFTQPNGFPLEADATLGFMQTDYQNAIKALAALSGSNYIIVQGCVENGNQVSAGWIYVDGDLVKFNGGTKSASVIISQTVVQKANESGALVDRYFTKTASFGTGSGSFAYSSLVRIQNMQQLYKQIVSMVALESAVVMGGCFVTYSGGSNVQISSGYAVIDSVIYPVPEYNGTFPVYFSASGAWANAQPGSGSFVKFDPYTANRYADVMRRASTPLGEVIMRVTLSSRFDNTGLGKWEMTGFALCNGQNGTEDMRGRFPVFYDERSSDPGNGIWDSAYTIPGQPGGAKSVTLTINQMPSHNHTGNTSSGGAVPKDKFGLIRRSNDDEIKTINTPDRNGAGDEPDIVTTPVDIPFQGGGAAHENRPPFKVFVLAQRI